MSPSNLVRVGGGLASIAAGVLLLLGHVFDLGGDPEYGAVLGKILVLAAHVVLVFALVALYAAQAQRSGPLGSVGMVFSVIGTTLVSGVVLVEIAGASSIEVDAVLGGGLTGALSIGRVGVLRRADPVRPRHDVGRCVTRPGGRALDRRGYRVRGGRLLRVSRADRYRLGRGYHLLGVRVVGLGPAVGAATRASGLRSLFLRGRYDRRHLCLPGTVHVCPIYLPAAGRCSSISKRLAPLPKVAPRRIKEGRGEDGGERDPSLRIVPGSWLVQ